MVLEKGMNPLPLRMVLVKKGIICGGLEWVQKND